MILGDQKQKFLTCGEPPAFIACIQRPMAGSEPVAFWPVYPTCCTPTGPCETENAIEPYAPPGSGVELSTPPRRQYGPASAWGSFSARLGRRRRVAVHPVPMTPMIARQAIAIQPRCRTSTADAATRLPAAQETTTIGLRTERTVLLA